MHQRYATMLLQLSLVVDDGGVARMIDTHCSFGLAQSAAALHTTSCSCTLVCNMKTP